MRFAHAPMARGDVEATFTRFGVVRRTKRMLDFAQVVGVNVVENATQKAAPDERPFTCCVF
jgi:hypothetical protein